MFQGLKFSFLCKVSFLFVFFFNFSLPVSAETHYVNVDGNTDVTQSALGASSDLSHNLIGGGTWDSFFTNEINVHYNQSALNSVGVLEVSTNTLTIKNGVFKIDGDAAGALVTLYNSNTNPNLPINADNFSLHLQYNKLNLTGGLDVSSQGYLYGAILQTADSPAGNSFVINNELNVNTDSYNGASVTLTGGLTVVNMLNRNFDTNGIVQKNQVTVNVTGGSASDSSLVNSDIYGGRLVTNIGYYKPNSNYTVTGSVEDNKITLTNGTFSGMITAGEAALYNAVYGHSQHAALNGVLDGNTVQIDGGTYDGAVIIGGRVALVGATNGFEENSTMSITNNQVLINGGTFENALIIACAATYDYTNQIMTGAISNNQITVSGTPTLSGATLLGGYSNNANPLSGNTLTMLTKGVTAFGVDGFNK